MFVTWIKQNQKRCLKPCFCFVLNSVFKPRSRQTNERTNGRQAARGCWDCYMHVVPRWSDDPCRTRTHIGIHTRPLHRCSQFPHTARTNWQQSRPNIVYGCADYRCIEQRRADVIKCAPSDLRTRMRVDHRQHGNPGARHIYDNSISSAGWCAHRSLRNENNHVHARRMPYDNHKLSFGAMLTTPCD